MLTAKVNNVSLAYQRLGRGLPMVLLHGYPLDHTTWEPVIPLLENHADLILPDLRGFGGSSLTGSGYSLVDMATDVAALLDHLEVEKAILVGHSMGGYVSLAFAHAHPRRVLGLGLVASQVIADPPERQKVRYETANVIRSQGTMFVASSMPAQLTSDETIQAVLREIALRQRPEGMAGALEAMAGRPDSRPFLAEFDFPIVIIHGREDRLIPIERAREALAGTRRGTLVEIEGTGHMPMMESPQTTAEALKSLL